MFCDEVKVHFIAGRGGKGCIGFRREAYVPRGGPNGGDGGDGGSIWLEANENINTLAEFNTKKKFVAEFGEKGLGKNMGGLDAKDLILPVPVGTMIFDEKKKTLIADLAHAGDRALVARGGRGGFGNAHFATSTRQAPRFAELGEPGEEATRMLELKLVADVGLIGLPSVGKSTLISRISNARPKIAAYPFTTIIPNLGLVTLKKFGGTLQQNFLACDLPGLIEGAHQGKGLGIQFLKHVARNRVLVHILDINALDPVLDYKTILQELKKFDRSLPKKPTLIAFNKIDTIDDETAQEIAKKFQRTMRYRGKIHHISCVSGKGIKELILDLWHLLEKEKKAAEEKEARSVTEKEKHVYKIFRPSEEDSHSFEIKVLREGKRKKIFEVHGRRIEQIVVMTDFSNPEAVARVYDVCEKMGIQREVSRRGAAFGDEIKIRGKTIIYRW